MHRENSSSTLFAVIKKMDAMKNTLNVKVQRSGPVSR